MEETINFEQPQTIYEQLTKLRISRGFKEIVVGKSEYAVIQSLPEFLPPVGEGHGQIARLKIILI